MPNVGLSERRIAEAALRLVDAEGIDGLSMRKLAQDLGVAPMSLYTHLADREAVLEATVQLMLAEIEVPDEGLDWRDTIRQIMRSVRAVGLRHPNAAPLINRFPPRTLDALGFVEAGFRAFRRAGFDDESTARCYRALAIYSMGSLDVELGGYFGTHPVARPIDGSLDAPTLERHLPNVAAIGPTLAEQDDAAEFEYGLELLLSGFASAMSARGTTGDAR
jgi:TetR/AcrR family transcriptional regulator, tetracycline repressor protein